MSYLVFEILLFLVVAALFGFVAGWAAGRARSSNELRALKSRLQTSSGEVGVEQVRRSADQGSHSTAGYDQTNGTPTVSR